MAPRISIVTSSYNQGKFITETIESIVSQNYPNLDYIIIDGGSKDETIAILQKYQGRKGITILSERDRGHADGLNKGFKLATGDIYGFVNSDDTLLPGALQRVADEIDPARGKHVVMGRCKFIDPESKDMGIEHPCDFSSHRRVLEIWKGHTIPQPSTFWTAEAWKKTGPMDVSLKAWCDYDFFCRLSRYYSFQRVDKLLATYRLHPTSVTSTKSEAENMAESIAISKRYWGPRWQTLYQYLQLSLMWHQFNAPRRAREHFQIGQVKLTEKKWLSVGWNLLIAGLLAPKLGLFKIAPEWAKENGGFIFTEPSKNSPKLPEQSRVYLDHYSPWSDGWVGPKFKTILQPENGYRRILLSGTVNLKYLKVPLKLSAFWNQQPIFQTEIHQSGNFEFLMEIPAETNDQAKQELSVHASEFFVSHLIKQDQDYRPLAWVFSDVHFVQ